MSNRRVRAVAAAFAVAVIAWPAQAEMYFSYNVGAASTHDSDVHLRQPSLGTNVKYKDVSYLGESFSSPLFYGFKLGTYLKNPSWLGVELEFQHYKAIADTSKTYKTTGTILGNPAPAGPMNQFVQRLEISHGVNLLMLNVVARNGFFKSPEYPNGRLQAYGGLGFGAVFMHPESRLNNVFHQRYQFDNGPAAQFLVGLRGIPFNIGWRYGNPSLFAEYKYAIADADFEVDRGKGSLKLRSDLFIFGVGWHF